MSDENKKIKIVEDKNLVYSPSFTSRSCSALVRFFVDKDKVSLETLQVLAFIMNNYPKNFTSLKNKTKTEMLMCNGTTAFSVSNNDEFYDFLIWFYCPSNLYVKNWYSNEKRLIKLGIKTFLKGPKTDEVTLTLAKGKFVRLIQNQINSPSFKSLEGLAKSFFPNSILKDSSYGKEGAIKAVDEKKLLDALKVIESSKRNISFVGFDSSKNLLLKNFGGEAKKKNFGYKVDINQTKEDLSITTSFPSTSISIAYKLKEYDLSSYKNYLKIELLKDMLYSTNGVLFKVLREQYGYTYGYKLRYEDSLSSLILSYRTAPGKVSNSIKLCDKLMNELKESLRQEEFDIAINERKAGIENIVKKSDTFNLYLNNSFYTGYPVSFEERIKILEAITLEDIKDVCSEISKIGSFTSIGTYEGE